MGSQVEALRASLAEMVEAMDRYDADATEPPPQRHVDMIGRARAALSGPRPSEPGRTEAPPHSKLHREIWGDGYSTADIHATHEDVNVAYAEEFGPSRADGGTPE
jgi:hypothetical protein